MKKEVYVLGGTALVLIAATAVAATLYARSQERAKQEQQEQRARSQAAAVAAGTAAPGNAGPDASLLIRPHSRTLGPADAKVTLVEFLDPECETCRLMYPVVKQLLNEYQGRMRLVVRIMPFHPNSLFAASALESAGEQGKYWEMLEALFASQPQWGDHHNPRPELIPEVAKQVGLDMNAFNKGLSNPAHKDKVKIDEADGKALGVNGTPTFFVNGKQLERLGYEPLKAMIDEALAAAR